MVVARDILSGYQGSVPPSARDYCRALSDLVTSGELDWSTANAMWRNYAASLEALYPLAPKPPPCPLGAPAGPAPPIGGGRKTEAYDPGAPLTRVKHESIS